MTALADGTTPMLTALALGLALVAAPPATQRAEAQEGGDARQQASTDSALIRNALSAAPAPIARRATVKSWDDELLKEGGDQWVCRPGHPQAPGPGPMGASPMCLNAQYRAFLEARAKEEKPHVERVGLGYMLQGLEAEGVTVPPHVMVVVPDRTDLEGISTERRGGMPWVMAAGTPYAHLMVPVAGRSDTP